MLLVPFRVEMQVCMEKEGKEREEMRASRGEWSVLWDLLLLQ